MQLFILSDVFNKLSWFVRMGAWALDFPVYLHAPVRIEERLTTRLKILCAHAHRRTNQTITCVYYTQSISLLRDKNMCDYMKM